MTISFLLLFLNVACLAEKQVSMPNTKPLISWNYLKPLLHPHITKIILDVFVMSFLLIVCIILHITKIILDMFVMSLLLMVLEMIDFISIFTPNGNGSQ